MNHAFLFFVAACAVFAHSGCGKNDTYSPDQVEILSEGVTPEKGLKLEFRPIAETSYHCPGVVYKRDGDKIHFTFLRQHINSDTPIPDLSADRGVDGALSVVFPIQENQDKFELINSSGSSLGSWEILENPKAEQDGAGQRR